jgi:hypothetical protein
MLRCRVFVDINPKILIVLSSHKTSPWGKGGLLKSVTRDFLPGPKWKGVAVGSSDSP